MHRKVESQRQSLHLRRRNQVYLQMHFGTTYDDSGKYGWTRDVGRIKETFSDQIKVLHTDYTDMGCAHCVDVLGDYQKIVSDGMWDYMRGVKSDGIIRHLGISSHTPEIVRRFLDRHDYVKQYGCNDY